MLERKKKSNKLELYNSRKVGLEHNKKPFIFEDSKSPHMEARKNFQIIMSETKTRVECTGASAGYYIIIG